MRNITVLDQGVQPPKAVADGPVDLREPSLEAPPGGDSAAALDGVFADAPPGIDRVGSVLEPAPMNVEPAAPAEHVEPGSGLEVPGLPRTPLAPPPAVPAPDAPDAAYDRETQELARGMKTKEQAAWVKERAARKQERQELLAKLEAAETRAAQAQDPAAVAERSEASKKLAEMERQVAEYEDKLGKLDLVQTVGFKEKFEKPQALLDSRMQRLLQQYASKTPEESAQFVTEMVQADPGERMRLLSDIPTQLATVLITALDQRQELSQAAQLAVENWKASRAAMSENERRTVQLSLSKEVESSVASAAKALDEGGNVFMRRFPGDTEDVRKWNAEVDQRLSTVSGVLQTGDIPQIARLMAEGVSFAPLAAAYTQVQAENKRLQAQLKQMIGNHPRGRTMGPPTETPAPPADKRPQTAEEAADAVFGRERSFLPGMPMPT